MLFSIPVPSGERRLGGGPGQSQVRRTHCCEKRCEMREETGGNSEEIGGKSQWLLSCGLGFHFSRDPLYGADIRLLVDGEV